MPIMYVCKEIFEENIMIKIKRALYFPEKQLIRMDEIANEKGITFSEIVRRACEEFIEREDDKARERKKSAQ